MNPASFTLMFVFGVTLQNWVLNELGVCVNAANQPGAGLLLDHALLPQVIKGPTQTLTLQTTCSMTGA